MKYACLLLPILTLILIPMTSWAASVQAASYAAPSQPTSAVRSANASNKNHPRSRVSLAPPNCPKRLSNSQKPSIRGNASNLRQPGSDKSSSATKGGVTHNETVNNALPVRRLTVAQPNLLSLNNNVRHRGPNPAIIGGSANSASRTSGAIDGTRMHRKP